MKKLTLSFTLLFLGMVYLASLSMNVDAAETKPIEVWIDGEQLGSGVNAQIIEDRTFVPIRTIAEKWGAVVGWNSQLRMVRISKDDQKIDLFIDDPQASVNGESRASDVAPLVREGRTMLPLRFVGELLGARVAYNSQYHRVLVMLPKPPPEPEESEEPDSDTQPPLEEGKPELALLQGISIKNKQVVLQTDKQIEPSVFYLTQPERIVIDIPQVKLEMLALGMTINGLEYDDITHQHKFLVLDDELIQSIRFADHDLASATVRIVVDLDRRGKFNITQDDSNSNFNTTIGIQRAPYKVIIDAGHGAHDPGASGATGYREKEFNLTLAKLIQHQLMNVPYLEAVMTRSTDVFLELKDRTDIANQLAADALLSVHANAFTAATRGTETYYTHGYQREFAEIMHRHLLAATGFPNRKLQQKGFFVTRNADMPAALIEVGFLTNAGEERILRNPAFQQKVAAAMVQALKEYFKL